MKFAESLTGGGKANSHAFVDAVPSTKTGTSTECQCVKLHDNPDQHPTQCTIGNCIPRTTVERKIGKKQQPLAKTIGKVCGDKSFLCEKHVRGLFQSFQSSLHFTQTRRRRSSAKMNLEHLEVHHLKHTLNKMVSCHFAPPSIHQDKTVHAVAAVSCFVEGSELRSVQDASADSGQLFLEWGGLLLPHGRRDVILLCGNSFHAPLLPTVSEATNGNVATRHSMASFVGSANLV